MSPSSLAFSLHDHTIASMEILLHSRAEDGDKGVGMCHCGLQSSRDERSIETVAYKNFEASHRILSEHASQLTTERKRHL
jgi:hypothetical protein